MGCAPNREGVLSHRLYRLCAEGDGAKDDEEEDGDCEPVCLRSLSHRAVSHNHPIYCLLHLMAPADRCQCVAGLLDMCRRRLAPSSG